MGAPDKKGRLSGRPGSEVSCSHVGRHVLAFVREVGLDDGAGQRWADAVADQTYLLVLGHGATAGLGELVAIREAWAAASSWGWSMRMPMSTMAYCSPR